MIERKKTLSVSASSEQPTNPLRAIRDTKVIRISTNTRNSPPSTPVQVPEEVRENLPALGDCLGKYRLLSIIGRGATGVVYRGEHLKLPLQVAVKVLCLEEDEESLLAQLGAEARLLAGLNHPNIVRLWDFDDEGKHPYLVTELVEGRTLEQLMAQSGPLLQDWALHLMSQVIAALRAAYEVGIVHRDVKPANILLTKQGQVKLADLGLALLTRSTSAEDLENFNAHLTGTAAYMSPEQACAPGSVDHRADIYSLGATFYHAMTGKLPFDGRSRMEVVFKHIKELPVPPDVRNRNISPEASALILRMMAKDVDDRFASYEQLAAEVDRLLA
jgi:serine/threonine protein kinase